MVGIAIGQGAFGTVLYGRHKVSQKPVAIKVILRHSLQKHPFLQQAILQEQAHSPEMQRFPVYSVLICLVS